MRRVDGKSTGSHGVGLLRQTGSQEWNARAWEENSRNKNENFVDAVQRFIHEIFDGGIVADMVTKLRGDPKHDPRAIFLDTEAAICILGGTSTNQTPQ